MPSFVKFITGDFIAARLLPARNNSQKEKSGIIPTFSDSL